MPAYDAKGVEYTYLDSELLTSDLLSGEVTLSPEQGEITVFVPGNPSEKFIISPSELFQAINQGYQVESDYGRIKDEVEYSNRQDDSVSLKQFGKGFASGVTGGATDLAEDLMRGNTPRTMLEQAEKDVLQENNWLAEGMGYTLGTILGLWGSSVGGRMLTTAGKSSIQAITKNQKAFGVKYLTKRNLEKGMSEAAAKEAATKKIDNIIMYTAEGGLVAAIEAAPRAGTALALGEPGLAAQLMGTNIAVGKVTGGAVGALKKVPSDVVQQGTVKSQVNKAVEEFGISKEAAEFAATPGGAARVISVLDDPETLGIDAQARNLTQLKDQVKRKYSENIKTAETLRADARTIAGQRMKSDEVLLAEAKLESSDAASDTIDEMVGTIYAEKTVVDDFLIENFPESNIETRWYTDVLEGHIKKLDRGTGDAWAGVQGSLRRIIDRTKEKYPEGFMNGSEAYIQLKSLGDDINFTPLSGSKDALQNRIMKDVRRGLSSQMKNPMIFGETGKAFGKLMGEYEGLISSKDLMIKTFGKAGSEGSARSRRFIDTLTTDVDSLSDVAKQRRKVYYEAMEKWGRVDPERQRNRFLVNEELINKVDELKAYSKDYAAMKASIKGDPSLSQLKKEGRISPQEQDFYSKWEPELAEALEEMNSLVASQQEMLRKAAPLWGKTADISAKTLKKNYDSLKRSNDPSGYTSSEKYPFGKGANDKMVEAFDASRSLAISEGYDIGFEGLEAAVMAESFSKATLQTKGYISRNLDMLLNRLTFIGGTAGRAAVAGKVVKTAMETLTAKEASEAALKMASGVATEAGMKKTSKSINSIPATVAKWVEGPSRAFTTRYTTKAFNTMWSNSVSSLPAEEKKHIGIDGVKPPKDTDSISKDQKKTMWKAFNYLKEKHDADPMGYMDRVARDLDVYMGDPEIGGAVVQQAMLRDQYLFERLPRNTSPSNFLNQEYRDKWAPSDAELDTFVQNVIGVGGPANLVDFMVEGSLTTPMLEAARYTNPPVFELVREKLLEKVVTDYDKMSYPQKLQASNLLGSPLLPSAAIDSFAFFQNSFLPPEDGGATPEDSSFRPKKPIMSSFNAEKVKNKYMTTSSKLNSRE